MTSEHLNLALQENLLTLLAYSDQHGRIVANMVEPELFQGDYGLIVERLIDYWRQYNQAPKAHTGDLFSDVLEDPQNKKAGTFRRILVSMFELSENVNTNYIMEQLRVFKRTQRLTQAIIQAAEQLGQKQHMALPDVEELLAGIVRAREIDFDPGIRLSDYDRMLEFMHMRSEEFDTGIKELDDRFVVPQRKAVMLWLGGKGRGKSWALINIGKRALRRRKRVLHITLEMPQEEVQMRYFQSLYAIPKRHAEELTSSLVRLDDSDKFSGIDVKRIKPDFSLDSPHIEIELQARIERSGTLMDNLVIKSFPSGSLTINSLEAYIDNLEATEGFIPDMIILDYVGITKIDPRNPRITLGANMREFRGCCDRRNIAGVTAQQITRHAFSAVHVGSAGVSEDWSLVHTADTVVTHACTDTEFQHNLGRLYVAHARSESDRFGLLITQNYKIGQFVISSTILSQKYFEFLEHLKKDEESDDEESEE